MSGCFPAAVVGLGVETMGAEPGGLFGNQTPAYHPSLLPCPKVYQPCASADREPEEGESSEASPSACLWEKSTHGPNPTSQTLLLGRWGPSQGYLWCQEKKLSGQTCQGLVLLNALGSSRSHAPELALNPWPSICLQSLDRKCL